MYVVCTRCVRRSNGRFESENDRDSKIITIPIDTPKTRRLKIDTDRTGKSHVYRWERDGKSADNGKKNETRRKWALVDASGGEHIQSSELRRTSNPIIATSPFGFGSDQSGGERTTYPKSGYGAVIRFTTARHDAHSTRSVYIVRSAPCGDRGPENVSVSPTAGPPHGDRPNPLEPETKLRRWI